MEEGAISQEMWAPLEAGKCKKWALPTEKPEANSPVYIRLSQEDPFQTSGLQNCQMIHLCCVEPLNLLSVVTAAKGKSYTQPVAPRGKPAGVDPACFLPAP